jgi:hypothetical protein
MDYYMFSLMKAEGSIKSHYEGCSSSPSEAVSG